MTRPTRLLSLLLASLLVAGACTGDGGAAPADEADGDGRAPSSAGPGDAADGSTADPAAPSVQEPVPSEARTIEELEAEWADARAAVVEKLTSGDYGVGPDNILRGPGGLEVDLNDCPAGWSDTTGLDNNTITIGHTTALSGPITAYGDISVGIEFYFDHINRTGGVGGRQLELIVKDDGYDAAKTSELIYEWLQGSEPFMLVTTGALNTLAVYDVINENCVPHPLAMAGGHPAWGDPIEHPFTTGLQMSFLTESSMWGAWIEETLKQSLPVEVAALVAEDEIGRAYSDSFRGWAESHPSVVSQTHALSYSHRAPTIAQEISELSSSMPDVFIPMTTLLSCALVVEEVGGSELRDVVEASFLPSECQNPESFMIPAGEAADGFLVVAGGAKTADDPRLLNEPFIEFINSQLSAAGSDSPVRLNGVGFGLFGWAHVEALRIAAELPGGLSRSNLLLAMRSLDLVHPMLLDGISFSMNGVEDAYYIEGSDFRQYDAASQEWVQVGDVIDINGMTPNCSWVDGRCE